MSKALHPVLCYCLRDLLSFNLSGVGVKGTLLLEKRPLNVRSLGTSLLKMFFVAASAKQTTTIKQFFMQCHKLLTTLRTVLFAKSQFQTILVKRRWDTGQIWAKST